MSTEEELSGWAVFGIVTASLVLFGLLVIVGQIAWVVCTTPLLPSPKGDGFGITPKSCPSKCRVIRMLAVGDSLIEGTGIEHPDDTLPGHAAQALRAHFEKSSDLPVVVQYCIVGKIGNTAQATRKLVPHCRELAAAYGPFDVVLLSAGVNDGVKFVSTSTFARELRLLLTELKDVTTAKCIVMSGEPPITRFPALPSPLKHVFAWRVARIFATARRVCEGIPGCAVADVDLEIITGGSHDRDAEFFCEDGFHPKGPVLEEIADKSAGHAAWMLAAARGGASSLRVLEDGFPHGMRWAK